FTFLKESEHLVQVKNATGIIPLKQRFVVGKFIDDNLGTPPPPATAESQAVSQKTDVSQKPILAPEEAVKYYENKYNSDAMGRTNVRKYVDYSGMANLMGSTSG